MGRIRSGLNDIGRAIGFPRLQLAKLRAAGHGRVRIQRKGRLVILGGCRIEGRQQIVIACQRAIGTGSGFKHKDTLASFCSLLGNYSSGNAGTNDDDIVVARRCDRLGIRLQR